MVPEIFGRELKDGNRFHPNIHAPETDKRSRDSVSTLNNTSLTWQMRPNRCLAWTKFLVLSSCSGDNHSDDRQQTRESRTKRCSSLATGCKLTNEFAFPLSVCCVSQLGWPPDPTMRYAKQRAPRSSETKESSPKVIKPINIIKLTSIYKTL